MLQNLIFQILHKSPGFEGSKRQEGDSEVKTQARTSHTASHFHQKPLSYQLQAFLIWLSANLLGSVSILLTSPQSEQDAHTTDLQKWDAPVGFSGLDRFADHESSP